MSKKLNFAIVGCGVIAPSHADSIKNIEGARLYAVCDIIPEKADDFAIKYMVDHIYYDYKEMMKDPAKISSAGHYFLTRDMVDAIREGREPLILPEEARTAVDLICTIYKSAKENREMDFQK